MQKRNNGCVGRSRSKENSARDRERDSEAFPFKVVKKEELDTLKEVAQCLKTVSNKTRLQMLSYCSEPRSFSDVVFFLRLNPATFKFHEEILDKAGLIAKNDETYKSTALGERVLDFAIALHRIFAE
jgi:hypothetical protein